MPKMCATTTASGTFSNTVATCYSLFTLVWNDNIFTFQFHETIQQEANAPAASQRCSQLFD